MLMLTAKAWQPPAATAARLHDVFRSVCQCSRNQQLRNQGEAVHSVISDPAFDVGAV